MSLTDKETKIEEVKDGVPQSGVVDLSIDIEKTPVRINGRNDSIIYLNLTDVGIIPRLEVGYERLQNSIKKVEALDSEAENFSSELMDTNKDMCEAIDYIFDSPVSEVLSRGGTMYDVRNGEYRFETILTALFNLYDSTVNNETKKLKARIKEQTSKYIPQDHKPKSKSQKRRDTIQNE